MDHFAAMFKALSNPQRLRIFPKLAGCCNPRGRCEASVGGMHRCVGDLGADLGLAASTVSHHIKELRNSGLMTVERRGQKVECWISEDVLHLLASFFDSAGGMTTLGDATRSRTGDNDGKREKQRSNSGQLHRWRE